MSDGFQAWVARENGSGYAVALETLHDDDLPPGDVIVDVAYSSINYKDALAVLQKGKIVRRFPMVLGVDLAGTVRESASPDWKVGDAVVINGWKMSEQVWGGYTGRARVKSDWLVRLPDGLSPRDAMVIGTAGYTAMLSLIGLEEHGLKVSDREIIVTGATGGVGSFATLLLARAGYRVTASTGRQSEEGYLRDLGASAVIGRDELSAKGPVLGSERWAGGVDSVGSQTLATLLATTAYGGVVAACGLAGGMDLPTSVAPFILRGVKLVGIDSVTVPRARRDMAWARLATMLERRDFDRLGSEVALGDLPAACERLLGGQTHGRTVVRVAP